MKGDFTRDTFDPKKHRLRVLQQQGRVGLDSDFNEQVSILLHRIQGSIEDLIGPYGGPEHRCGFEVRPADEDNDFSLGEGVYYVNGMLCQNESAVLYTKQPEYKPGELENGTYLVYLEAWERHVTAIEDESIREVALGGADTSTRSEVVWQARLLEFDEDVLEDDWSWEDFWEGFRTAFELFGFVRVRARRDSRRPIETQVPYPSDESARRAQQGRERTRGRQQPGVVERGERQLGRLAIAERLLREKRIDRQKERGKMTFLPPEPRDSLVENQLYMVEIHKGGLIRSEDARKAAEEVARAAEEEASRRGATNESVGQKARERAEEIRGYRGRSEDARKAAEEVARAAEEEASRRGATNESVGQKARERAEEIKGAAGGDIPTVKWAYDNASVVFPIVSLGYDTGNAVATLGAPNDGVRRLQVDDCVEIVDREPRGERPPLLRVGRIDRAEFAAHLIVTLVVPDEGVQLDSYEQTSAAPPLLLRRWNSPGTVAIEAPDKAISLKDGFQVRFGAGRYQAGDYWSIPVRASARNGVHSSEPAPPHGISRHYAPLAVVSFDSEDGGTLLLASSTC
jgi:hypothetical protein